MLCTNVEDILTDALTRYETKQLNAYPCTMDILCSGCDAYVLANELEKLHHP